ncbi:SDR family NAD(P)-dependent oxidoreductase [Pandoraea apista]|uniref:SDR family NAD(P)-dependent oxidoreductase n=1 Tax=Pandoraea apista TaxID=93218 RepID=UPI00058A8F0A|nr:SDR family oxidoreductase [Pandoraea apista]AJE98115.1 hypothetical protein SG18_07815 [Pandoraea apista]AKH72126.1 hypothetical protein XM39_07830 [Pandoraea apista]AKI60557.1 hypothetical protein AA956_00330 [Pandoraea apista]AVF38695.1 SDR family oxidoreductase [Pandoraea apista]
MSDATSALKPHMLIIGASSGIGAELTRRAKNNCKLSLLARRVDRLEAWSGPSTSAFACDVSDGQQLLDAIKAAVAAHGKIDRMVYCAGKQLIKPMRGISPADLDEVVRVNLTGALVSASAFASARVTTPEASFLVISSIAAQRPEPGIIAYSAAKAGLDTLVHGLARECAPKRVIGIAPGWLDTEMTQALPHIYDDAFRERLSASAPRGIASVEEVVDLAEYLMSDSAQSITGQTFTIDGGASL